MSLVLILGSVWAYRAWGTYWQWDPKETAALFTWLIYGVYLHTRSLRGWRGSRSAVILLVAFAAVVFTYFGNYVFGGLHAYGGVLERHAGCPSQCARGGRGEGWGYSGHQ